jgi:hypothetical protein
MQRSFGGLLVLAMAVSAIAMCGSFAQASVTGDSISIAFARDEPPGTPGCALAATDVAGAPGYASANWVNETTANGSDTKLVRDTNGVATTTNASVSWTSSNTWATQGRSEFTNAFAAVSLADESLMTGYLDAGGGGSNSEVDVTGLPADIAAGYSVVIYSMGGVFGRPSFILANGNQAWLNPGGNTNGSGGYKHVFAGTYAQVIGDDPTHASPGDDDGNYVVFTGLSGDLQILGFADGGGTPRVAINAIQIIKN